MTLGVYELFISKKCFSSFPHFASLVNSKPGNFMQLFSMFADVLDTFNISQKLGQICYYKL